MNTHDDVRQLDTTLQVLADHRRRTVLQYLVENGDDAVTIDELVAGITDGESPPEEDQRDTAHRITVDLHHVHLPKLAEAGIIEYDQRSNTVRYHSQDPVEEAVQTLSNTLENA